MTILDVDQEIASSQNAKFHFICPFNFDAVKKYAPFIEKYLKIFLIFLRIILLGAHLIIILAKLFLLGKRSPKIMIIQVLDFLIFPYRF